MKIRHAAARFLVAALIGLWCVGASGAVVNLPKYNVSVNDVSVSGLSSGGYMAVQMHFAYSATVRKGAGVVAGGPLYCSEGNVLIAEGPCMNGGGSRNLSFLLSTARTWSRNGYIDPTRNLFLSKVYLLSGTLDSAVLQPVMDDLRTMYTQFLPSANIAYKNDLAAEHGMPTDFFGNACSVKAPPYINNCNFDAAGHILNWIYGPLRAKKTGPLSGVFLNFDQAVFWGDFNPTAHGMAESGFAYVPANCAAGQVCRLHVAFHGCKQNADNVGDAFYRNAGYNRWADTNNIVVLYPQAARTAANQYGCWDWWGYEDLNFPGKSGGQMVAVKTMIDRIVSGNAAAPFKCVDWFSNNLVHVANRRAYVGRNGQVYAVNSNQYLGFYSASAFTSVRNTSAGYYAYGKCS
ncbi:PHB depolymerase family esterase [Massilia sp. LXY-6]|uniref:extracellular catalytic domain type 2 short-chain-length polyhydroxyalkanoate depolymerase n=1 Tax=Massilia sp. LXY-6 TaxID=3379823 RepID=UPI003EE28CF7